MGRFSRPALSLLAQGVARPQSAKLARALPQPADASAACSGSMQSRGFPLVPDKPAGTRRRAFPSERRCQNFVRRIQGLSPSARGCTLAASAPFACSTPVPALRRARHAVRWNYPGYQHVVVTVGRQEGSNGGALFKLVAVPETAGHPIRQYCSAATVCWSRNTQDLQRQKCPDPPHRRGSRHASRPR